MPLRDYQSVCHDAVLAFWGEEPWHGDQDVYRSVLVNLATSAGKTVTAGAIIDSVRSRGRCLFLADTDELCAQPRKTFYRIFKIQAALEKAEDRASMMADVVVGSAQTLDREKRLKRFPPDHFSYVFVDEAHRGSDRNKKITDYFQQAKVMGMTATAFRAKLADLSAYYEHVAFEMGVFDLINEGYIAPIKVLTLPVRVDISQVRQKKGDYDLDELDTTIQPFYEEICRLWLGHAPNRFTVCFLPLIKSSQEFVKIARAMGINARHVDGKSPDRREILRDFAEGRFQLLSNSSLLTTGWDCERCDCLLNLAPGRSAGLFRQKVGRIGRILPGVIDGLTNRDERIAAIAASLKPDSLILDLLWQTEKFNIQGPTDLIANNEQERQAIQMKLRGSSSAQDLQEVTAEVQEAHEKRLRDALIEGARKQSKLTDSIELIAAMLHGRKVLNYEPVMNWHSKAPSDEQKAWLENNGIDPASAKDRGHVKTFMDLVFSRKKLQLCPWRAVPLLEAAGIKGAVNLRAQTAYEVLGGNYPMGFSKKHKNKPLKQVPPDFWEWCEKAQLEPGPRAGWFKRDWPIEWQWAQQILHPDGECTCIGVHQSPNCPVHPRQPENNVTTDTDKAPLTPPAEEQDEFELFR